MREAQGVGRSYAAVRFSERVYTRALMQTGGRLMIRQALAVEV